MLPGFYRRSNRSAEIRRCPDYRADQTDHSSCSPVGEPVTGLGCREWTSGAFCQQCNVTDGSRYFSFSTSTCKVCTGNAVTPVALTVVAILVAMGLVYLYRRVDPHERFPKFQVLYLRAISVFNTVSLRAKMKQCVGFYQVLNTHTHMHMRVTCT